MPSFDSGDTSWVLASAALVLLMTPGLAFFYGGMVRAKSVLNMLMMSFATIGIVSILWVLYGFAEAFGNGGKSGFYGTFEWNLLGKSVNSLAANGAVLTIPVLAFAMFQLMFAVITPALISGAIADRAKFLSWGIFVALWVTLVYFPVAHWVFDFGGDDSTGAGWLAKRGVEDFAGGTAVHINAGAAGLALALVLGKRIGWPRTLMKPHNLPLVLIGAAMLWFGWFGFNAGSALAANGQAALAFTNTMVATASALIGWITTERIRDGHPTSLGAASGAVAGLVAITPACAFIAPWAAVLLGLLAGAICALCVSIKFRLGFDDSLDVVAVHLVGGLVGCLFIGFFGQTFHTGTAGQEGYFAWGAKGLLTGGGWGLLGKQALGAFSVMAYSFVLAYAIGWVISKTIGFRVSPEDEVEGIDVAEHLESGYEFATLASSSSNGSQTVSPSTPKVDA